MAFEKGISGNHAGRKPGIPNKATSDARDAIAAALAGADAAKLAAQLDTLTGREYIDAYVKLAEFITPKLQRTSLNSEEKDNYGFVFNLVTPRAADSERDGDDG